jgi:hypothetical protein
LKTNFVFELEETSLDSGNDVPFFPKQEQWIEEDMEE